jgi:hypothetical protein
VASVTKTFILKGVQSVEIVERWVGRRANLEAIEKKKSLIPAGIEPRSSIPYTG